MKVLLLEDNPSDARRIASLLAARRIDVVRADSLRAAQTVLLNRPLDAVLVDLSLPDSAGVDTVVRVYRVAPSVPIVVLSGHEDIEVARNCVRAGASSYVVKSPELTAEALERELVYAAERAHRSVSAGGFLHGLIEHGTLLPYVVAIDEALTEIDTYLHRNHPSSAVDVAEILRRRSVSVALHELRGIGKGTEALRIATMQKLTEVRSEVVELKMPNRWLVMAFFCGFSLATAWWLK